MSSINQIYKQDQHFHSQSIVYKMNNNANKIHRHQRHAQGHKHKKEAQENQVVVTAAFPDMEYPEYLSKVNYLALDAFEASMQDQMTHQAYHKAIIQNQHLFAGKTVLHLTDGVNCLYSIFAARSGSRKVYCVVNGDSNAEQQSVYMMRQIIKQNEMEQIVEVLCWREFNAQVDIIIAEPMGHCLHFDGLLDRFIQARDLYLTQRGLLFPSSLSFKCALIHDEHFVDHKVNYWENVYGVPMISMKKWISHQPIVRTVDPALIVSSVTKILTFDLHRVPYEGIIKIDRVFEAELLGCCKANGIVFWFEAMFGDGVEQVQLKASPWVQSTKFTQVSLYWPEVLEYNGGRLRIRLKGQKYPKQGYSVISTEVDGRIHQYSFS